MNDDPTTTLVRLGDSDLTVANEAEDIRGRKVIDKNGDETGSVDGLLIDEPERKVRFLEIGSGGFLGLGKKQVLVPVDAVTRIDDEHVYINRDREEVASGPGYDPELMPEPDRPYYEGVYGYYGFMPYWGTGYRYPGYPYF
ncbi:PRC-barrel domain-containing protein [Glycomyces sp. TRM65418]|uniref:PRC-barrel domain-containing protein n=1 Tax=Glycomyces sp. TRM65418 TaxID=2867006 RepID=UPI001CE65759|nr:PRC-barrel domain-containing protein [Glycomyces sp. TRM65418]MCC3765100.1 PRC-barrel domain-containing protein [Glycomyces sp. TRM65418]QZD54729.1 PRC-barrel domain-containing protein [Glycomyces sp. TRM65418]